MSSHAVIVSPASASPRYSSIDLLKGIALISMVGLHTVLYFRVTPVTRVFGPTDSYIFSTFLFCFAVGNGISSRTKRWAALGQLVLVYVVAGAFTSLALEYVNSPTTAVDRWMDSSLRSLALMDRFRGTDFLFPFVFLFFLLLLFQRYFREWNAKSAAIASIVAVAICAVGVALPRPGPTTPLGAFIGGFRCLQSMPLFVGGLLLGTYLRSRTARPTVTAPVVALATAGVIFILALTYVSVRHGAVSGFEWKKSSGWSYPAASIGMGVTCLIAADGGARLDRNPIVAVLIRIGQKTFPFLWAQFMLLAALGPIAAATGSHVFQLACAIAVIPLVTAVTLLWPAKGRTPPPSRPDDSRRRSPNGLDLLSSRENPASLK